MENLKNINITRESKHIFKKCFDENDSKKDIKKIEWQFLDNPINKQFVDIAIDTEKNKTAGIYAISPVNFKINNEIHLGSQSLDTITDKDYRGQGLFINLANNVYDKAKEENVKLVYGFPNGKSIHGFKKKLDWVILDPLPFLIKPLKSKYFTKNISFLKFLPDIKIGFHRKKKSEDFKLISKSEFPDEVNKIWEIFSQNISVAVQRDKKYLDWRYLEKPNENYKIIHCYSKDEEYIGYIVYAIKEKHGGKIGYIMEHVYNLNYKYAGGLLLNKAVSEIKSQDADCILSWCLEHSPNYIDFRKELFFNMPEKIRPIELHFGARSFDENLKELVSNRKNWYLSYSDSDTV